MGIKMNRNIKLFKAFVAAVIFAVCLCSCEKNLNPDRITEIYFVSFTSAGNSLYMNADHLGSKWLPRLKMNEALELAHEVEAIPDPVSDEGVYSYIIRINYVEDGVKKTVEKTGYNTFPDNWDRVVELTNTVAGGYDHVTNSRELAVVNADYLRKYCSVIDESIIPEGMTLDDIIENMPITYLTLYDPVYDRSNWNIQDKIVDYLYDYLDLKSHQIEELDKNPAGSSKDEMLEFANSRLDEVKSYSIDEYSCMGSYKGIEYIIVRYDTVQAWLDKQAQGSDRCGFTGPHCQFQATYRWEFAATRGASLDVFVDGSGKYLILTNCRKPGDIADVVK